MLLSIASLAQQDSVQLQLQWREDFLKDEGRWKIQSTADNLFLVQQGYYIVQRKNVETGYAVLSTFQTDQINYVCNASFKLDVNNSGSQYAGIIFMANEEKNEALVLEVNGKQEMRVLLLSNNKYKPVSGTPETKGWIKCMALKTPGNFNTVSIQCNKKNYNILINNSSAFRFTELSLNGGVFGISIGESSTAYFDYIELFSPSKETKNLSTSPQKKQMNECDVLRLENELLKQQLKEARDSIFKN